jgi:hypothetical protein
MKTKTRLIVAIALILGLSISTGVLVATTDTVAASTGPETTSSSAVEATNADSLGEYAEGVIEIVLGDTISVSGGGATVEGATVNITAAGVYSIKGTLVDGCIDVDAKGKVYLEFDGVDITSTSGPALTVTDAKKVTITLVDGTTNYLTDTANGSADDAALFTNDTLIINGSGTLVVTGNNNEGISSDDDVIINSGTVKVTALDDGINAHDDVTVNDGEVTIIAGGDGIDSNGTVNINGGSVVSYGGSAAGDGGMDAIGAFTISGGTLIAGGNSVAVPGSDSTQCSIYVPMGSAQAAGTTVRVERDGQDVITLTLDAECQNLLISSSRLAVGSAYQVYVGDMATPVSVTAAATPEGAGAMGAPAAGDAALSVTVGRR